MAEVVRFKHSVNSGDLIAALPGIKHIYDQLGKKSVIYQRLNVPGDYYTGAVHPLKDEKGVQVTMTQGQWDRLVPLLKSQEYIEDCIIWEGQEVDIDFDEMRNGKFSTMPYGVISRWQFYTHPLLACDLSVQWITVEDNEEIKKLVGGKIFLNFTERYRNPHITYYFLKKWEDILIFGGTKDEHEMFCKQNKLDMPYLNINSFLHTAQAIKHSKLVLCNQSTIWNIADAMKELRVLEACPGWPHCPPNGANGYDFLHQGALEIYINKFMK